MTALERAARDVERGDHWLARQRLESHLATKGYDPDVLARLGHICFDMHDACNAGRMWLTSSAPDEPRVQQAIDLFLRQAGKDPRAVVLQLPRVVRQPSLNAYPPAVQARLDRLGLADAVVQTARYGSSIPHRASWGERIFIAFLILVLLFVMVSCCVGIYHIGTWLF